MDEPSKGSQSAGNSVNHPRPFFYVQNPIQPFYAYQWHMNNPYSHHSFPGSGFHQFGRPYMVPYSFLQYPGYIMPHTAMHPVDYRRTCDRNFPHAASATTYDITLRQHGGAQRETMCAGAQTDPCDALNKLIECLDQLRAGDTSPKQEKRSGMVAHASSTSSPLAEEEKGKEEEETGTSVGKLFSDSTLAEYDAESTSSRVGHSNQQEDWSLDSGKEPPLDSSSVHEEGVELQEEEKGEYVNEDGSERLSVLSQNQSDTPSSSSQGKDHDEKVPDGHGLQSKEEMQWDSSAANQPSSQTSTRITEGQGPENREKPAEDIAEDYSCCILLHPEKVLSAGSSLGSSFSYSYCPPQLAQERMSVLSPSLDELSSHDELLSTDFEDKDLFPTHIYTRGKLAEVTPRKSHSPLSDVCLLYPKRLTCAVCGSHAFKELSRLKSYYCEAHSFKDVDDSDEEAVGVKSSDGETGSTCEHCLRGTAARIHVPKKVLKHRAKLTQHREKLEEQGKIEVSHSEHFHCEKYRSSPEKSTSHAARGVNAQPCKERRCKTMGLKSEQNLWESVGGNARPKACRPQPLPQRQERPRKVCCRPQVSQGCRNENLAADNGGAEDNEDDDSHEMLQFHKGKGTTKRGGARC